MRTPLRHLADSAPSRGVLYSAMPALPPALTLRPATDADTARIAALLTRAHPDSPVTVNDLERQAAMRLPGEDFTRLLAEHAGQPVGLAESGEPRMDGHPGWRSVVFAALDPAHGPALLEVAETAARKSGATTLVARVQENGWEHGLLLERGYTEHDRMWFSTLDLRTLDVAALGRYEERARAAGLTIAPLSALGPFDEAAQRRLYALMAALLQGVPSATPVSVWPFEVWQHRYGHRLNHPEGVFIAVAPDGGWVGLSELHMPIEARPGTLHNGLTGVLAPYRGQGLATALKVAAARAALGRGFTHARTSNHQVNAPMLAVNGKLGFVREAAMVTLVRRA